MNHRTSANTPSPLGTLDGQNLIPVERVVAIVVRGGEGLGERSNNHRQQKELKKSQWKRDQNPNWQLGERAREITEKG
jgi:hypothetical protein